MKNDSTFFDDFTKSLRVLDSCTNRHHLNVAINYFDKLLLKWSADVCSKTAQLFRDNFYEKLSLKTDSLHEV